MSEKDTIASLRAKLERFETKAPTFDALFGNDVPGDAPLRRALQSKLADFEAAVPPFYSLMGTMSGESVVPYKTGNKRRLYPLWVIGIAAAACIGLLFLLPVPLQTPNPEIVSQVVATKTVKRPHRQQAVVQHLDTTYISEKIQAKSQLTPLSLNQQMDETVYESQPTNSNESDSSRGETFTKLNPTRMTQLSVSDPLSVDEAYAKARLNKKKKFHEKAQVGINVNGANRLLSFVNTNQGSDPLMAVSSDYSDGTKLLASTPVISLRSDVVTKNEWESPANILSSSLSNYKATYSIPLNVGFSVSIPLNSFMELQTGLSYTYLQSKTEGLTGTSTFTLRRELHYIGVPLKLAFHLFKHDGLRVYLGIGGTLEKGLSANQSSVVVDEQGVSNTWTNNQSIYGVQPLTNALAGISYEWSPGLLIYFEPGASMCFDTNQPTSIRTEEPISFNLGLGLRYRFN